MRRARDRHIISGILSLMGLARTAGVSAQTSNAPAQPPTTAARVRGASAQAQPGSNPLRYRVNYRPSDKDPWQLYAETRSRDKANTIASEVRESGYRAQVVDDLTPAPQPYPDASETSASD